MTLQIEDCPDWLLQMRQAAESQSASERLPRLSIKEKLDLSAELDKMAGSGLAVIIERAAADMASRQEGERNNALFVHAADLFGHVKGGHPDFTQAGVELALTQAASRAGLTQKEIDQTLRSAWQKTEAKPYEAAPGPQRVLAGSRQPATVPETPAATEKQDDSHTVGPAFTRAFERVTLDITKPAKETKQLLRWLYGDGCFTTLQSEPGLGKSWLALWAAVQIIERGETVIYLDEEGGPDLIHERLILLGADPEAVDRHLWLYCFEGRCWDGDDQQALEAMLNEAATSGPVALAILDSLPDHLTSAGLSEDKAQDVTSFMLAVGGRLRARGIGVLLLDHLVKPQGGSGGKSRYARGSGAKLAKADATLLVESDQGFDAHNTGLLRLWKTKDRRGKLDLPQLFRDDDALGIQVKPGDGRLAFTIKEAVRPGGHLVTPERATAANIVSLFRHKIEAGQWMTLNGIKTMLKEQGAGRAHETISAALEELCTTGVMECQQNGQSYGFRMTQDTELHEVANQF